MPSSTWHRMCGSCGMSVGLFWWCRCSVKVVWPTMAWIKVVYDPDFELVVYIGWHYVHELVWYTVGCHIDMLVLHEMVQVEFWHRMLCLLFDMICANTQTDVTTQDLDECQHSICLHLLRPASLSLHPSLCPSICHLCIYLSVYSTCTCTVLAEYG